SEQCRQSLASGHRGVVIQKRKGFRNASGCGICIAEDWASESIPKWKAPLTAQSNRTFERPDRLTELAFPTVEIADSPVSRCERPRLIDHLGDPYPFFSVGDCFVEVAELGMAACERPTRNKSRLDGPETELLAHAFALKPRDVLLQHRDRR